MAQVKKIPPQFISNMAEQMMTHTAVTDHTHSRASELSLEMVLGCLY